MDYQKMTIDSFTGGISDKYINEDLKFTKLENFRTNDNGTVSLRYGTHLVDSHLGAVRGIGVLDHTDIVTMGKESPVVKSSTSFITPDISSTYKDDSGDTGLVSMVPWRNSLYIQPKGGMLGRVVKENVTDIVKTIPSETNEVLAEDPMWKSKKSFVLDLGDKSKVILRLPYLPHPRVEGEFTSSIRIRTNALWGAELEIHAGVSPEGIAQAIAYQGIETNIVRTRVRGDMGEIFIDTGYGYSYTNTPAFSPRKDYGYVSERGALPLVKSASVTQQAAGSGPADPKETRVFAICLERKYQDADKFYYLEYSPEFFGSVESANKTEGLETLTISVSSVITTIDHREISPEEINKQYKGLKMSLFLSKPFGTTLYKAGSLDVAGSYEFVVDLKTLDQKEQSTLFSETLKDTPPKCNFFAVSNNTGYYAGTYQYTGSITDDRLNVIPQYDPKPFRLFQSVPGMPTTLIADAYLDLDGNIEGIADLNGSLIIGTHYFMYRLEGQIGVDGSGNLRPVKIQTSEGLVSHYSMVVADEKLYYAGTDGIYVTDGFSAVNISGSNLYNTYSEIISDTERASQISATYDRDTDTILFNMGHNIMWVLHTKSRSFTTYSFEGIGIEVRDVLVASLPQRNLVCELSGYSYDKVHIVTRDKKTYTQFELMANPARYLESDETYTVKTAGGDSKILNLRCVSIDARTGKVILEAEGDKSGYSISNKAHCYEDKKSFLQHTLLGTSLGGNTGLLITMRPDISSDLDYSTLDLEKPSYVNCNRRAIRFDLCTAGLNYGDTSIRKWVKDVTLNAKIRRKFAVGPYTIREDNAYAKSMSPISNLENFKAFDVNEPYGRFNSKWFPTAIDIQKRHMPTGMCRVLANQIGFKSVEVPVLQSLDFSKYDLGSRSPANIKLFVNEVINTNSTKKIKLQCTIDGELAEFPEEFQKNATLELIREKENSENIRVLDINKTRDIITCQLPKGTAGPFSAPRAGELFDYMVYSLPVATKVRVSLTTGETSERVTLTLVPQESESFENGKTVTSLKTMPFPYDSNVDSRIMLVRGKQHSELLPVFKLSRDRLKLECAKPTALLGIFDGVTEGEELDWILYSYPIEQNFNIFAIDVTYSYISTVSEGSASPNLRGNYHGGNKGRH